MGTNLGRLALEMRSLHKSLSGIRTVSELEHQHKAPISAAKTPSLQMQAFKQEIEVIKMLKGPGCISEEDAKRLLQKITQALLMPV